MIRFTCPHCGRGLKADEAKKGKTLPCPNCAKEVVVAAEEWQPSISPEDIYPVASEKTETTSALIDCSTCGRSIAKTAAKCPQCGAPNAWVHPEVQRFRDAARSIVLTRAWNWGSTQTAVWGNADSEVEERGGAKGASVGATMLGVGVLLLFFGPIGWTLAGLLIPAGIFVSVTGMLFMKSSDYVVRIPEFRADFSGPTPKWESNDEEFWEPVRDFFELPSANPQPARGVSSRDLRDRKGQRTPTSGTVIAVVSGLFFGIGMGAFVTFKEGPESGLPAGLISGLIFGPVLGFVLRGVRIAVPCQNRDQFADAISTALTNMKYQVAKKTRRCIEFQHSEGGMAARWYAISVYIQDGSATIVGPAWYVKKLKRRLPKAPAGTTAPARQGPPLRELASRSARKCAAGVLGVDTWLGRMLGAENALLHKFLRVLLIGIACVVGIWLLTVAWHVAGSVKAPWNKPSIADTPIEASGSGGTRKPRPTDPNDPRNLIIGKWQFVEGGGGKGEAYITFGLDGMLAFDIIDANVHAKWNYEFVDDTHIRESYRKPATGELRAWTERIAVTKDELIIFDPEEGDRRYKRVPENGRQDHLQSADKYRDAAEFDKAIAEYDQAIALEPNNAAAYRGRALSYYGKLDFKRAIEDSTKAIELDPKNALAYATRGRARLEEEGPDQAIADCTEAIRLDPKNGPAYRGRGGAYIDKKDYDQAISDENMAIQFDPKDAKAYRLRGFAYSCKDNVDQAISDYTEAIRLDPQEVDAVRNRALMFYEKEKFDEAIQDCTTAIRLDPNDAETYFVRAGAYRKKGLTSEVIRDCTEVIRLDPNHSTAYLLRGEAYQRKGLVSEAQEDFARAKELGETIP